MDAQRTTSYSHPRVNGARDGVLLKDSWAGNSRRCRKAIKKHQREVMGVVEVVWVVEFSVWECVGGGRRGLPAVINAGDDLFLFGGKSYAFILKDCM